MTQSTAPLTRARRVLLIFNPIAGARHRGLLEQVTHILTAAGLDVDVRPTAARGDAERFAAQADPAAHDLLLVAGGDGTLNEALNGLGPTAPPLALLPMGTANVVAAEIGLRVDAPSIAATALNGRPQATDLGLANGRRFIMMAGVGLDAHVVAGVSPRLKRGLGRLAYAVETLRQILRGHTTTYTCVVDGQPYRAAAVIVANGRLYGGRFICAPQACLNDGRLQVVLFERTGRWNALRYAVALFGGRLGRVPDVHIVPGRVVEVQGPAGEPVQVDGDIVTHLPLRIEIQPAAFQLLVPR